MDYAIQQILNAFSFGAEYALLALGLAIVFSIMRLVNFAYGEIIAFGGYSMVIILSFWTRSPFIVIPIIIICCILASILLERIAFRPIRGAELTTGLLAAFGVSIILQNLFLLFGSPRPIAATSLVFMDQTIPLGSFRISSLQVLETLTTFVAIIVLVLFMRRSVLGIAMRAASLDFEMVRLCGIRANRVIACAFAVSGLLAGLACVFIMARRGSVDPLMGFDPVLKAFVACVIGGFGSLTGAVLGGFLLGFVEVGVLVLLPYSLGGLTQAIVFLVVAIVLIWRPDGILTPVVEKGDKL